MDLFFSGFYRLLEESCLVFSLQIHQRRVYKPFSWNPLEPLRHTFGRFYTEKCSRFATPLKLDFEDSENILIFFKIVFMIFIIILAAFIHLSGRSGLLGLILEIGLNALSCGHVGQIDII